MAYFALYEKPADLTSKPFKMKKSICAILLVVVLTNIFISNTTPYDPASPAKSKNHRTKLLTDADTNMLFVSATIGDKQLKMLVDNGAPTALFIDAAALDDYRILNTTKLFDNEGDTATAYITKINKVCLGTLLLKKQYCLLLTDKPQYFLEMGVSGIIGHNILNQLEYTLDFVNFELVLSEKADEPTERGSHSIALQRDDEGLTYMNLRIDTTHYLFQVDYGSSGLVDFSTKNPPPDLPKSEYTKVHLMETVNQRFADTSTFYRADSIFFAGDLVFTTVPVTFRHTNQNLIGMKFFRQFESVSINSSNNTMTLRPIPIAFDVAYKQINCYAIQGQSDSCMIGSMLLKNKTETVGMQVGDTILKPIHVPRVVLSKVKGVAL